MSNKKITDLTEYTSSQVKLYDLLFITDIDNQETKKIKALELGNYVHSISSSKYRTGSFTGSFIGIASTASHLLYPNNSTASNALTASYVKSTNSSSYALTASYSLNTGEEFQLTAFEETINQSSHGLSIGDAVYKSGSGFYTASAYTGSIWAYTTEVVGVVKNITNTNSFIICYGGIIDFDSSPPTYFSSVYNGTALFLTGSSGKLVNYDPSLSDSTQISKPVMLKLDDSRGLLFNQRGVYEDDAEQYTIESASYAANAGNCITASYALFALNGGGNGNTGGGGTYYVDNNPIGSIIAMATTSAPINYLLCDGSFKKVNDYLKLANAILQLSNSPSSFGKRYLYNPVNQTFTPTDNLTPTDNTYFKLPDLRGTFIRGLNNGSNNAGASTYDTNRAFGSIQEDAFKSHQHAVGKKKRPSRGTPDVPDDIAINDPTNTNIVYSDPTGSNETRPVNIALNYYIKYDKDSYQSIPNNVGISGDVNGNLESSKVVKLQGIPVSPNTPSSGSYLVYDTNQNSWIPSRGNLSVLTNNSGYTYLPTGILMQWGTSQAYTSQQSPTISFPISFPNTCLNVQATWKLSTAGVSSQHDTFAQIVSFTNTSATFQIQNPNSTTLISGNILWFAIGY